MFQRFVHFTLERATGKTVIILLVLYIIFSSGLMGWGAKHMSALSGKEVQVLDLSLSGYTPEQVNTWLADYTPEARAFAVTFGAIADTAYPIVYTVLLTLAVAWVYKRRIEANPLFGFLLLLPMLMMVLDFLENYHIITMLQKYPAIPEAVVHAGSMLTVAKWSMFWVILAVMVAGLALKVLNRGK